MNASRARAFATIIPLIFTLTNSAHADDLWIGLEQELRSGDVKYSLHKPIKNNRPPGFIYTNFRAADGTLQTAEVCNTFNPAVVIKETRQFPLKSRRSREVEISAGLEVAAKHLINVGNVATNLKRKGIQTTEIEFGEVVALEIPEYEVPRGNPKEVDKACNARVRGLIDSGGRFFNKYEFWFIQKTLSTDRLDYSFNTTTNLDAKASVSGIKNAVDVSAGVTKDEIESGTLNVQFPEDDPYYIGYVARKVTRWKPVNLVSPGDHAQIELAPVSEDFDAGAEGKIVSFEDALAARNAE